MTAPISTLEAVDDNYGDLETFIRLVRAIAPDRFPATTIGGAVLVRLRELYAPVRFARHTDVEFCVNALGQLPDVTRGLSPSQNEDLLALVRELHAMGCLESSIEDHLARRWRRDRRRLNNLRRRLKSVYSALVEIDRDLRQLDISLDSCLDSGLQSVAGTFDPDELPTPELVTHFLELAPTPQKGMVAIHDFFVEQCGLEKSEAQVRVGKIVNQILGANLTVIERPRPRSDERRGCEAVRKAVERQRERP